MSNRASSRSTDGMNSHSRRHHVALAVSVDSDPGGGVAGRGEVGRRETEDEESDDITEVAVDELRAEIGGREGDSCRSRVEASSSSSSHRSNCAKMSKALRPLIAFEIVTERQKCGKYSVFYRLGKFQFHAATGRLRKNAAVDVDFACWNAGCGALAAPLAESLVTKPCVAVSWLEHWADVVWLIAVETNRETHSSTHPHAQLRFHWLTCRWTPCTVHI